ncbi:MULTISPECIES: DUF5655 domain-containing protein [unclassified Blastococcus]|uniref:DUF5655 domain-containing protein n=1 Tax=unclassified Blastococcus TaxID=2619396 RepID=UPI001EF13F7F|nr:MULTISPECIES: DUF5655 domain-containing protein [unclassified Blastococcus]
MIAGDAGSRAASEEHFAGSPLGLAVLGRVREVVATLGGAEERASRTQVAFRRRRGFAYLWLPGRYVRHPSAEVVLSLVLGREDPSPRFLEVAHPAPAHWVHHLGLARATDVDDEVVTWLAEAAARADPPRPRGGRGQVMPPPPSPWKNPGGMSGGPVRLPQRRQTSRSGPS